MQPRNKAGKFITEAERKLDEWADHGLLQPLPRFRIRATGRRKDAPHRETMDEADMAAAGLRLPPRRHADVDPAEAMRITEVMSRIHAGIGPSEAEIDATLAKMAPQKPTESPICCDKDNPAADPVPRLNYQQPEVPAPESQPTASLAVDVGPARRSFFAQLCLTAANCVVILICVACFVTWTPALIGIGVQIYLAKVAPVAAALLKSSE
jgi:hypothetical protein